MSDEETERMRDALWDIKRWAEAYPVEVFPEPDLRAIRAQIGDDAFSALHGTWGRHILAGIARYVRAGLGDEGVRR